MGTACTYTCWVFIILSLYTSAQASADSIWLDIDTRSRSLRVMDGEVEKVSFDNIAVGRFGTTRNKHQGDNKTPLGQFNIASIKESDRFYLYLGLDYPNLDAANRAYRKRAISRDTWKTIRKAFTTGQFPPQHTPLGGHIGIHGVGNGDLQIHQEFNWTSGCIAITNEQIGSLLDWVQIGTPVTIH